jgi:hypothetical protein
MDVWMWDVGVLDLDPRRVEMWGVTGSLVARWDRCAIDARTWAFDFDLDPVPTGVQSTASTRSKSSVLIW